MDDEQARVIDQEEVVDPERAFGGPAKPCDSDSPEAAGDQQQSGP